ncbi:MAG: xanthine dehydrogenase molybdopterin binding subunit [Gammaproteobacteria bacterium]|nr:xanthine dehydrogenase molybdopterin binding subunit [Gammaproteobacteria bacterium]
MNLPPFPQDRISVSRGMAHDSAVGHVSGEAPYVDDYLPRTRQSYACVGMSPVAHGTLVELGLDEVRNAEGVLDVITADDIPGEPDIGPVFAGDPLFAADTVQYLGQPLFAVAADSMRQARKAALKAKVQIKESPAILDLDASIQEKVHVRPTHTMTRGDADAVLDASLNRIQGFMRVGGQEHFYLEGQVSLTVPGENGSMDVHCSTQNPSEIQKMVAQVLGLSMNRVNVIVRRMGGGFGGKETQAAAWACIAAIFSTRTGRAVLCRLSRHDDMVMTGKRHNFRNDYDVGFDADGRIQAICYQLAGQCGYSPDLSDAIVDRAMFHCDNAYYLPNARIDGIRCRTHTVSNTAFRGFGGPQGMIAMETVIDEIAYHCGKDPLEIRKLNFYDTEERSVTPYYQKIEYFNIPKIIDELEKECDYQNRRKAIREFNQDSSVIKKGLSLTPVKFGISFTTSFLNQTGALVHLYTDGSIHLNHGGTEMGQGLMIKVAQIVSEIFAVDSDKVVISPTRTDKVPNTPPTAASAGTDMNGMAARYAALTIRERLTRFLSERHEVSEQRILFTPYGVRAGDSLLTLAEVAKEAWLNRISLSATGFYRTPKIHYDRTTASGRPFYYFANGAAASEVAIDTLTGEYRLLRTDIIHDVGDSINPAIDIGQVEGGFIQGLGWLTSEELKWDSTGRLLSDGPATYKIPAVGDIPPEFHVRLLRKHPNEEETVYRSKAVGEPPLMLAISAWCAIRDAIGSIRDHQVFPRLNAPATPEEILKTIIQVKG